MTRVRNRGEEIRSYILQNVEAHPTDISKESAIKFGVSRQAINLHLKRLEHEGALVPGKGKTRSREYLLAPLLEWRKVYLITQGLEEDVVWRDDISPVLGDQPENVKDIWQYGFTEMFNNARDHSEGTNITVLIEKTAVNTQVAILDDGIGIFRKIQNALGLLDERHAIFELTKGKLTTDPDRHTGEGIFFTSRMFDSFDILSAGVFFTHQFGKAEDWILERTKPDNAKTSVWLKLNNHTARTVKRIFDQYSTSGNFGFTKTMVPVRLAQYGNEKLISRSQAKRVVARIELFNTVIFNFKDVPTIGQGFADEIFRVFASQHPGITIYATDTNDEVRRMIERVKAGSVFEDPVPLTAE
jgi:anti-sigma regulatory factor (Ser/Thr protein kinase)